MKEKGKLLGGKLTKTGRKYDESIKRKIVSEVNSGLLSSRGAERKYGVSRNTINCWITELSYANFRPLELAQNTMADIKEEQKIRLLAKQVLDLTKELEKSKLKISSLETMIEVSEENLKIKIRKKPGAKQSRE